MATTILTREDVFQLIREAEPRIRDLGVRRLALFGSVMRDEARPDSDVDLLVQFQPGERPPHGSSRCTACSKICSPPGWNW